VVFLLLVDLNRRCAPTGVGPDLMAMLDLVALATVADVAPLRGVNRAFVRQGLTVMARRHRKGLVALCDVARLDRPRRAITWASSSARGQCRRADREADLGARLLATDDPRRRWRWPSGSTRSTPTGARSRPRVRDAALAQAEARGLDAPLVWAAGTAGTPASSASSRAA
jgi:single-stranded-DNA-specific exonuclease